MSTVSQQIQAKINSLSSNAEALAQVNNIIQVEDQKHQIQQEIHNFTKLCFNNCININSSNILNADLTTNENQCLTDCVGRYLDVNLQIVKTLQNSK
ncbi:related to Mitochondrial import inner membrane translocase subunit TIM8 [Hanseniaspora guilliermondii]|uniref:Mitochondrial import inner membrane translocase subunit n=1 Tax=Hanseniaspora guilliermondii TaxID=56406 RepID=A0A1L0CY31_9ASCO|nr:related to Mitochondrial import inner membrane translocase subunit TIM8 [Hanseniaspora guilliermondii]